MPRSTSFPLHWLTLAVILPLVVIAGLAVVGTRSQLQAARAEAREAAERQAPALAAVLDHDLGQSINEIPTYPDPPRPGSGSPKDDILDGSDLTALEALRNDPNAGLSPAGLPRRTLAALVIHRLDPSLTGNETALENLVTVDEPSVLSSRVVDTILTSEIVKHRWRKEEEIRDLVRELGLHGDTWLQRDGRFLHLVHRDGVIAYTEFPDAQVDFDQTLPSWAEARLALVSTAVASDIIASSRIRVGSGLELRISADTSQIEAPVRRQQRWIFAMLATSVATAAIALAVLHRTLRRERQLNDLKSQFVASVSHELRAPVASIRLMADALEDGKVEPETASEFHRLIAREGARLSTLVGNVLDHARIEQGRKIWRMEPCDLAALASDTLQVMEPLAREKGIRLASGLSPVEAAVDAGAIQQALVNLIDNAIKFSPDGSTVTITLSEDEEHRTWVIAVSDEGSGVPKEEEARIFERFYRPGDELRRETQGAGIGLSLVKSIAEAHGGKVELTSTPGNGSVFKLIIPLT
ncbi:sensor histidine kinase [Luteolibacter marinus]|uniref:sensor histidine kinase n=1 Tax=Luteolibacter marinus TaxID=2776705 RepID=UPI001866384F|nr:HAMP domain-containing sensor histidine kinase [Luteolibacter marinus]